MQVDKSPKDDNTQWEKSNKAECRESGGGPGQAGGVGGSAGTCKPAKISALILLFFCVFLCAISNDTAFRFSFGCEEHISEVLGGE